MIQTRMVSIRARDLRRRRSGASVKCEARRKSTRTTTRPGLKVETPDEFEDARSVLSDVSSAPLDARAAAGTPPASDDLAAADDERVVAGIRFRDDERERTRAPAGKVDPPYRVYEPWATAIRDSDRTRTTTTTEATTEAPAGGRRLSRDGSFEWRHHHRVFTLADGEPSRPPLPSFPDLRSTTRRPRQGHQSRVEEPRASSAPGLDSSRSSSPGTGPPVGAVPMAPGARRPGRTPPACPPPRRRTTATSIRFDALHDAKARIRPGSMGHTPIARWPRWIRAGAARCTSPSCVARGARSRRSWKVRLSLDARSSAGGRRRRRCTWDRERCAGSCL